MLSANWIEVSEETNKNGIFSNLLVNNNNSNNSNQQVSSDITTINKVKYSDIQGKWYAEGTSDVTLEFYENNGLYMMSGTGNNINGSEGNFDVANGKIDYSAGNGTSIYVDGEGYIWRNELYLENSTKLVFSKNGNKTNFYRTANYPQHIETSIEKTVKNIVGYWYLDGYKNTYLRFYEENSNGNQSIIAETQNLNIDKNTFEILEEANYKSSYIYNSSSFGATGIYFIDLLMDEQQITYSGGKLYIKRNGNQYSFTKSETRKSVKVEEINFLVSTTTMTNVDILMIESLEVYPGYADDKTITFSSSNSSIAYVDSSSGINVIKSKDKEGIVTITARNNASGVSKSVTINVQRVSVNGVQLNEKDIVIEKGNTKALVATITPNNAYNKKLIWTSSNTNIVKVTSNGSITAVGAGTANITVQTEDGGYTDTCTVTVKNAALNAKASIGYTFITSTQGMVDGVKVTITPSDGSGIYTYYSIKLYKDGILIKESTDTSSNQLFAEGYKNGEYTVEYVVKDSEGNTISGESSSTIS